MAKISKKPKVDGFILYDIVYQDGSLSSNRKVARADLSEFDVEAEAKAIIEAQDRTIAEASGRPRGPIKSMVRRSGR